MNGLTKLFYTILTRPSVVCRALRWQHIHWRHTISRPIRFVLFATLTFFAYFIFTNLATIKVDMLNQLAAVAFFEALPFVITVILIIFGCTALLFSLLAAKLAESLLNDPI